MDKSIEDFRTWLVGEWVMAESAHRASYGIEVRLVSNQRRAEIEKEVAAFSDEEIEKMQAEGAFTVSPTYPYHPKPTADLKVPGLENDAFERRL